MNKKFTKEDIIKKHETNVKSAFAGLSLSGVLGIIYVVRYFITGNFNFHFSLSLAEMMLKLGHAEIIGKGLSFSATAVFFTVYTLVTLMCLKKTDFLKVGLAVYAFDFLCLIFFMVYTFLKLPDLFSTDLYIEVILHIFNILFLSVGVYSDGKLKKIK